jgi:predicted RNase H-like HicB family nuclease
MHKVILHLSKDGHWVATCRSYPDLVSEGRTKLEARAKFRKAIQRFEKYLDHVESDPKFIEMMKRSDEDIRAGRVFTQEEAERIVRRRRKLRRRVSK